MHAFILIILGACLMIQCTQAAMPSSSSDKMNLPDFRMLRHTEHFDVPKLIASPAGLRISLPGCVNDVEPGSPALPVRGVTLPVPPGCRPRTIRILPRNTREIDLPDAIAPVSEAVPLSRAPDTPRRPPRRNERIYSRRSPYPDISSLEAVRRRIDRRHGRDQLTLSLHPTQYLPAEGRLLHHQTLTVEVVWEDAPQDTAWRPRQNLSGAPVVSSTGVQPDASAVDQVLELTPTETTLPAGRYDHVIVAPSLFITNTPPPWNLETLIAARQTAGLASTNVSVEWIDATYPGRDKQERIRNFIRTAYDEWQTRFVLLAGNHRHIPARKLYCLFSGYTEWDYPEVPADGIYYGCLDGDFDNDGDNVFGEIGDGPGGEDVDLLAEVQVGRFLAGNTNDLSQMIRKTLAYEATPALRLEPVSHVGEYMGFGGVADYASGAMEQIRLGATDGGFTSQGFAAPYYLDRFDTSDRLYDAPDYQWTAHDMLERLSRNRHVFNHLGHGNATYCFKISLAASSVANREAIAQLTNTVYSLAYSQACNPGRFDSTDCFAEQFLRSPGGAFATIMNTRYGWGYTESIDGPSQRFHRTFWDSIFVDGHHHLGTANQKSKEKLLHLLTRYSANVYRWCYYELTLFGDPATPFAARLLPHAPEFDHAGLQNQFLTNQSYAVEVSLGPASLYDATTPRMIWRTSRAPDSPQTNALAWIGDHRFRTEIPPQPMGTTIDYRLLAETLAGVSASWPENGEHRFEITPRLTLSIDGEPDRMGAVSPSYGVHAVASGTLVRASAPVRIPIEYGLSEALRGAVGSGSVGDAQTNVLEFVLRQDSSLSWQWALEYALMQTSNVPGLLDNVAWYPPGSLVTSAPAPATISHQGISYTFANWYLDEQRQPEPPGEALNPIPDILIHTSRLARALMLPTDQDQDENGLADWWEYRYFGALGQDPGHDFDGDGFTLLEEYLDRTDPLDSGSFPQAPTIEHQPLDAAQNRPPPYEVTAWIHDTRSVASAQLFWRHNTSAWQTVNLSSSEPEKFDGTIDWTGEPDDQCTYRIVAADPAGHVATNGPHEFRLVYPQIHLSPTEQTLVLRPTEQQNRPLAITNRGNATLQWTVSHGTHEEVSPATTWQTNATRQAWRVVTHRAASAPYAFHGAQESAGSYSAPPAYADLISPPLYPGPQARLHFKQWIHTELDSQRPGFAFDGGMVQISTNGGQDFLRLDGPYSHRITGWDYSPWPDGTPCFAGDGEQDWQDATFDLSPYAGQVILLRFVIGGDNNTDLEGWYLDDLRVGPVVNPPWPEWAAVGANGGMLPAGQGFAFPVYALAVNAPERNNRLSLFLRSNDPVNPVLFSDWELKIRELPLVSDVSAIQSSTQGEGRVTFQGTFGDPDGEPLTLQIEFSRDAGLTWERPLLDRLKVAFGPEVLSTSNASIHELSTTMEDLPTVNSVQVDWLSHETEPVLPPLAFDLLMRVTAANPWFTSDPVITTPFAVDNQAPVFPDALASHTHTPEVWSSLHTFGAQWLPADDGAGVGEITYAYRLSPDPDDPLSGAPVTEATAIESPTLEGADVWFAVQARDAFGNRSAIRRLGAFAMDITPPEHGGASVTITRSAFGNYAVGPSLPVSWDGFHDALSGIKGYYLLQQADTAVSRPVFQTTQSALLEALLPGVEHNVLLFAVDRADNASHSISDALLVLAPDADDDGDGHSAAQEELAGTDALNSASILRLGIRSVGDNGVELYWPSLAGRRYSIHSKENPRAETWLPLPSLTNLPGTGSIDRHRVWNGSSSFYRLYVAPASTP